MRYLREVGLQRRNLTHLARQLGISLTRHNGKRRVPLGNDDIRIAVHDACLGPDWGACTNGLNALQIDTALRHMVDTMQMRNGYELAVAQACIRAGKHAARMARADMAILRDSKGRTVFRPMTHAHRMARFKAASEFYALAREYQSKHEEARRAAVER